MSKTIIIFCAFSWSGITTFSDWFSQPIRSQTKIKCNSLTHIFPCFVLATWLHVIASSCDWFSGLSFSFVIGQSDNFGFSFIILQQSIENRLKITLSTRTIRLFSEPHCVRDFLMGGLGSLHLENKSGCNRC